MTAAAISATALSANRSPHQEAVKIGRWPPSRNQARAMLGHLAAELPSGMMLNDGKPMRGRTGKHWIAWLTVRWPLIGRIR